MLKLAISPSASALLRGLLDRAGLPRDRMLLSQVRSVDSPTLLSAAAGRGGNPTAPC